MNYIILNDVNSNTIQGLLIQNLPPITKPKIRTNIEEIDGRDGDIITKLGYSAYDKEFDIGLYGNYDVDQVISYFNSEGTVIFSNEDDKFYKYTIIEQIDFERLIRFKTAKVKMHVQPFKYSNTDTDIEIYATETDAEGTNLTINNTENGASFLDMQLKGQTTQNTTNGNNLLNIYARHPVGYTETSSGVTFTYNNDGSITANGTATANINFFIASQGQLGNNIFNGTNYLSGCTGGSLTTFYLQFWADTVGTYPQATTEVATNKTSGVNWNITIGIKSGVTINKRFYPMMCATSGKSFEMYTNGASPNPSYPQNVNVVTGNTSVNICNKNLWQNANNPIITTYGITLTTNDDNSVTMTGTPTNSSIYFTNVKKIMASDIKDGNYTLSFGNGSNTSFLAYRLRKYNGTTKTEIKSATTLPIANYTYTLNLKNLIDDDTIQVELDLVRYGTSVNDQTLYPQIEVGNTATSYVAHQEQNYTINLGTNELCQIGQYQDYIYKNNGKWFKHKAVQKIKLDGSETYVLDAELTTVNRFRLNITSYKINSIASTNSGLCNQLKIANAYSQDDEHTYSYGNATYMALYLFYNKTRCADLTALVTWLSANNVIVYGGLATPIDEEITDENLIAQLEALRNASTYINQTNIITSGNLAPIIYVNVDTIDTNEIEVVNSGNIYSKPVVTITGIGTINLYLNDYQVFILELGDTETTITLDVENMEAYNINTGQLMNRQVTGDYNNFIFNAGTNIITWSGTIASVQIVNYSRWI